jgi:hypothetical protein
MGIEFDRNMDVDMIVYCEATIIGGKPCTAPSYNCENPEADSKRMFWSSVSGSVKS